MNHQKNKAKADVREETSKKHKKKIQICRVQIKRAFSITKNGSILRKIFSTQKKKKTKFAMFSLCERSALSRTIFWLAEKMKRSKTSRKPTSRLLIRKGQKKTNNRKKKRRIQIIREISQKIQRWIFSPEKNLIFASICGFSC